MAALIKKNVTKMSKMNSSSSKITLTLSNYASEFYKRTKRIKKFSHSLLKYQANRKY